MDVSEYAHVMPVVVAPCSSSACLVEMYFNTGVLIQQGVMRQDCSDMVVVDESGGVPTYGLRRCGFDDSVLQIVVPQSSSARQYFVYFGSQTAPRRGGEFPTSNSFISDYRILYGPSDSSCPFPPADFSATEWKFGRSNLQSAVSSYGTACVVGQKQLQLGPGQYCISMYGNDYYCPPVTIRLYDAVTGDFLR
ncbi:MAG: hypothetical protein QXS76_00450, partial [Candidatus Bathyarchaeia archaeon]